MNFITSRIIFLSELSQINPNISTVLQTEVHAINESSIYLMKMIHEIGLEVRSSAVCSSVRRIRYGHFGVTHALLTKHCDARSIAENIDFCRPLVNKFLLVRQSDVISSRGVETIGDDQTSRRKSYDDDYDIDSPVTLSSSNQLVEEITEFWDKLQVESDLA